MNWVLRFPDFLVPKKLRMEIYFGEFFEWIDYKEELMHEQCEGNNGKIFDCMILGKSILRSKIDSTLF